MPPISHIIINQTRQGNKSCLYTYGVISPPKFNFRILCLFHISSLVFITIRNSSFTFRHANSQSIRVYNSTFEFHNSTIKFCADQIETSTPPKPPGQTTGILLSFVPVGNLTFASVGWGKLNRKCQVSNDFFFGRRRR